MKNTNMPLMFCFSICRYRIMMPITWIRTMTNQIQVGNRQEVDRIHKQHPPQMVEPY